MEQNNFKKWYSQNEKIDNLEVITNYEKMKELKFPKLYKKLVRFHDGGTLKKNIFTYMYNEILDENVVGFFLPWQKETLGIEGEYIIDQIESPPEFFPKGLIPFAPDGGGNYLCFDYRNCRENPPIVYWDHGIEENEGIFFLADSFEEFINSLKSEEEIEALLNKELV